MPAAEGFIQIYYRRGDFIALLRGFRQGAIRVAWRQPAWTAAARSIAQPSNKYRGVMLDYWNLAERTISTTRFVEVKVIQRITDSVRVCVSSPLGLTTEALKVIFGGLAIS